MTASISMSDTEYRIVTDTKCYVCGGLLATELASLKGPLAYMAELCTTVPEPKPPCTSALQEADTQPS